MSDVPEIVESAKVTQESYSSPHDKLVRNGEYRPNVLKSAYDGNLDQVFSDLDTPESVEDSIFMPARIIRGIADARVEDPSIPLQVYIDSIDAAKSIYADELDSKLRMQDLHTELQENYPQVLDRRIKQSADAGTVHAGAPEFSERTVQQMEEILNGRDFVLVPLAHGGVAIGIDVFLRATSDSRYQESIVLPVRYSRNKMKDEHPQIDPEMDQFFQEQIRNGKPIVIFEEDRNTGITGGNALAYFQEKYPDAEVHSLYNRDNFDDW
ncbi:hypothetical protein A2801_01165 [Candidatus Woesebacteria bacterium RIFCSPHIGHO2_01_FULL_41_10]|uniref:Uncharacterized protein n=1 Tax=Candidatus Woesebacteria bacterium RIFCSPHIGHO2_01_FULL_41_10 TaxID=1802500 RepID=A0A1F7YR07_9BACT|nr:MAG: hypothetical protein A2801_01165 [Candidatus Woesebacteria bacterium RIFCSPHIGHO2_01_FULL_41_10]